MPTKQKEMTQTHRVRFANMVARIYRAIGNVTSDDPWLGPLGTGVFSDQEVSQSVTFTHSGIDYTVIIAARRSADS